MKKTARLTQVLVLFSGVSVLSFGAGYFATLQLTQKPPQFFDTHQPAAFHQQLLGLPLNQARRTLRRANFKFLTTSAYSLVNTAKNQPAAADSLHHRAAEPTFSGPYGGQS